MPQKEYNKLTLVVGQKIGGCYYVKDAPTPLTVKNRYNRFVTLRCECGNEFDRDLQRAKKTTECNECLLKRTKGNNFKHGLMGTTERIVWAGIKQRCFNTESESYPRYGGRGIGMFEGWVDDFKAFYDYIRSNLGERPSPQHSLDRIDNDKNYEPGNLRWGTRTIQANNRSSNRLFTYKGDTNTIRFFIDKYNLEKALCWSRVDDGWDIKDIIERPKNNVPKIILDTSTGVFYNSIREAAKIYNIGAAMLGCYLRGIYPNKTNLIAV